MSAIGINTIHGYKYYDFGSDATTALGPLITLNNANNNEGIMGNTGDILVYRNSLEALPIGTARQVLQVDSAGEMPEWTSDIAVNSIDIANTTKITDGNAIILATPGTYNTFVDTRFNTSFTGIGTTNVGIGAFSQWRNLSGSRNTSAGVYALQENTYHDNTAFGYASGTALNGNLSYHNSFYGSNSGGAATTNCHDLIAIGYGSGGQWITNCNNSIVIANNGVNGDQGVIRIGTDGTHSTTYLAGRVQNLKSKTIDISDEILVSRNGDKLLSVHSTSGNVACGYLAGPTGGLNNTCFGKYAGIYLNNQNSNTAIGSACLGGYTGTENTIVGYASCTSDQYASSYNTLVGAQSGISLHKTESGYNSALGNRTFLNGETGINNNIAIGYLAGSRYVSNCQNNILIGATGGATSESNYIRLGNATHQGKVYIADQLLTAFSGVGITGATGPTFADANVRGGRVVTSGNSGTIQLFYATKLGNTGYPGIVGWTGAQTFTGDKTFDNQVNCNQLVQCGGNFSHVGNTGASFNSGLYVGGIVGNVLHMDKYDGGTGILGHSGILFGTNKDWNYAYTRVGRSVTFTMYSMLNTSIVGGATAIFVSGIVPSGYRPLRNIIQPVLMAEGGDQFLTVCKIDTSGSITFYRNPDIEGNFSWQGSRANTGIYENIVLRWDIV
jgi:hypothetical protein